MSLHPQDVLVALKLAVGGSGSSYAELGRELDLSASQAHAAVKRASVAGLLDAKTRKVNRRALLEFLEHGAKYVFPAKRGPVVRGLPTAHSASPLKEHLVGHDAPVVWPDPEGEVRGESLEPLHKSVPRAARRDPQLYASLVLVDGIRAGRARERNLAVRKLEEMLLRGR